MSARKLGKLVDGIFAASCTCIEPIGVPQCSEFYRARGQKLFTVGLNTATQVRALHIFWVRYNPNSLAILYLTAKSGRCGFPVATLQLIEALVDTLLALDTPFPFIFALGGKMAFLPDALVERVSASGRGLVCKFLVEQRAILQHAALGWFLTHGGWKLPLAGHPAIIWPMNSEQPVNAALLALSVHPVAIELMQVRTGMQLAPALRGGPTIAGTVADASAEFKAAFDAALCAGGM
ncbi:hypothetical protein B0H13DRAFT_1871088 [Mycena leptocephala]|nr:hypothetical protein B0H13DRAFT_1871088 [Mycena leptocephala]